MNPPRQQGSDSIAAREVPALRTATLHLANAEATLAAGARLARVLAPPLLIALHGELGAGKTTLVRGVLRALGWTGPVKSPTYTLVEHYQLSSLYFYHFDFYRFEDPDEWDTTGFAEYFSENAVCVVEWPERAGGHLPVADLAITLDYLPHSPEQGRTARLAAHSERGLACLSAMAAGA